MKVVESGAGLVRVKGSDFDLLIEVRVSLVGGARRGTVPPLLKCIYLANCAGSQISLIEGKVRRNIERDSSKHVLWGE